MLLSQDLAIRLQQYMEDLKQQLEEIKRQISLEQQCLFSLKSIDNFIKYNYLIKFYQNEVHDLLTGYFTEMKAFQYDIDKETSTELGTRYVMKLGYYYSAQAGFKMQMKLSFAIFWGILVDILLLISGVLSKVHYIPISTLLLFIYCIYLKIFYEQKNKVYAVRY